MSLTRYNSPTNMMDIKAEGDFVTYADAMEYARNQPVSFNQHLDRQQKYNLRAEHIVRVYAGQQAIAYYLSFQRFNLAVRDANNIGLELGGAGPTGSMEQRTLSVPIELFEKEDDSDIVAAARTYKVAEIVRREEERKARDADNERVEREMACSLLRKYPDLLTEANARPTHVFSVDLSTDGYTILVSPATNYGTFEHKLLGGTNAGGLWFSDAQGTVGTLQDYDGVEALPRAVVSALRSSGYAVSNEFD